MRPDSQGPDWSERQRWAAEEPRGAGPILADGTEIKTDKAATCFLRSSSAIFAADRGARTRLYCSAAFVSA